MDFLKFCCSFCDLDFFHSNFKVTQYLMLTIAFKLVLSQSSQILLPLCNPAIPSLAVSCLCIYLREKGGGGCTNACICMGTHSQPLIKNR